MRANRVLLRWTMPLLAGIWILLTSGAAAEPHVIDLAVRDGVLPKDQRLIRVQQGEDVALRWTTDRPVTVHVHGYDVEVRVEVGRPTTMTIRARAAGRFPITTHPGVRGKEDVLGYLEVHPK